jgi:hypothetical protein
MGPGRSFGEQVQVEISAWASHLESELVSTCSWRDSHSLGLQSLGHFLRCSNGLDGLANLAPRPPPSTHSSLALSPPPATTTAPTPRLIILDSADMPLPVTLLGSALGNEMLALMLRSLLEDQLARWMIEHKHVLGTRVARRLGRPTKRHAHRHTPGELGRCGHVHTQNRGRGHGRALGLDVTRR